MISSFSHVLFTALCILLVLGSRDAEARPTKRAGALLTLPLTRIPDDPNVHPEVRHQQLLNRSLRRYASLTGREGPSDEELSANLVRRLESVEKKRSLSGGMARRLGSVKRFNLPGAVPSLLGATGGSVASTSSVNTESFVQTDGNDCSNFDDSSEQTGHSLQVDSFGGDAGYFATIQIGTPARDFKILLDTGSADLWVGTDDCVSLASGGGGCGDHIFLSGQTSSTFVNTSRPFQITYGSGAAAGFIVQDTISIAGLTLQNHVFGIAQRESDSFANDATPFDGLMGLAPSILSAERTPTPPESLAAAGLIQEAITSFKLSRFTDNATDGEVTFGGLDPSKFDQQTAVVLDNISKTGFWQANMSTVTANGEDLGLGSRAAILDTGTTLLVVPVADAQALHAKIPGAKTADQQSFTIPCSTNVSIALTFGGESFTIDNRDLARGSATQNPSGECSSGIAGSTGVSASEWLVGDTFLKAVYYSVNAGTNKVTLAKLT